MENSVHAEKSWGSFRFIHFIPTSSPPPRLELLFPGGEREIYSRHGICIRPAAGF